MNWLHTTLILGTAFLAVFWEAAFSGVRHLLGAQIDLLPPLMVYAALNADLATLSLLAVLGGLWFDSLSVNPLGVSVLPLFVIGLVIFAKRDLILRDEAFAQLVLGFGASALAPVLALLVLMTAGHRPALGLTTLWQWAVMSVGGALMTPVWFGIFDWLRRTLMHSRVSQISFRPDREIRRGKI
jgi:cell shape-determining protein MreD